MVKYNNLIEKVRGKDIKEIMEVKGINEELAQKIKDELCNK